MKRRRATGPWLRATLIAAVVGSVAPSIAAANTKEGSVRTSSERDSGKWSWSEPILHRGFVAEARVGALGCTRVICQGSSRHDAEPGVRVAGSVGGNIAGFVELGISGGWGMVNPRVAPGTNLLDLYGVDPELLQQEIESRYGTDLLNADLDRLIITGHANMDMGDVGPMLRVHFIPKGRIAAHVGTGARYLLVRSRYQTRLGPTRLDFHGIGVPVEGAVLFYPLRQLSIGAHFEYTWSHYLGVDLDNPYQRMVAPVSVVQDAADVSLRGDLPRFWSVSLAIRATL